MSPFAREWLGSDLRIGHFFSFRCPLVNTPPLPDNWTLVSLSVSHILWSIVGRPVCLGIKHPSGAYDQIFIIAKQSPVCRCGTHSLTTGRPSPRSHFRVQDPWDSRQYFTVSDSRLHFSSPLMTRRVSVQIFDPHFHTGYSRQLHWNELSFLNRMETTTSNSSSFRCHEYML
jgi:hypothetical protein